MSAGEHCKELAALVKKLRVDYAAAAEAPPPAPGPIDAAEPLLGEFLRSFLIWEATTARAGAALSRFEGAVVDFNELRICLPDELVRMMGERYPRVEERALRLRAALNEIYRRQHAVTLEPLHGLGKREAKDYLDSLEGVPRFVSSRVFLLCLGGHAAPTDGRIARRLVEAHVAEPGATPESAAAAVERKVRAGELIEVYRLLQAWADDAPAGFGEAPPDVPRRREKGGAAPGNHQHAAPVARKPAKGVVPAGKQPLKKKKSAG